MIEIFAFAILLNTITGWYKQRARRYGIAAVIYLFSNFIFLHPCSLILLLFFMDTHHNRYFIINKPYNMVSQFVSTHDVQLLGDLDFDFPGGTHAIGRLDNHSEGLLLLTTNKKVTRLLFLSEEPHIRTYLVQVNNIVSPENLQRLQNGVTIKIKTGVQYTTAPCDVSIVTNPETLYDLGERLTAWPPFTWLLITITEGKYHQVRKMIAAIRHKCKRLIRTSIEDLALDGLAAGAVHEIDEVEFFKRLKIEDY